MSKYVCLHVQKPVCRLHVHSHMCVSVSHIWSESVHVSGCWLSREVAGAIENLRCFHRDDGNLRDFPYGSEIIFPSRSFKYRRLIPPPH